MESVPGDHGHHDVQLQLAGVGCGKDRRVTSDHLVAHLVHHLGDGWIDLAGHDRRAGLDRRQQDLRNPCPRPHAEQPQVRGDLPDLDRKATNGS
jgi:hypothetical protein